MEVTFRLMAECLDIGVRSSKLDYLEINCYWDMRNGVATSHLYFGTSRSLPMSFASSVSHIA